MWALRDKKSGEFIFYRYRQWEAINRYAKYLGLDYQKTWGGTPPLHKEKYKTFITKENALRWGKRSWAGLNFDLIPEYLEVVEIKVV